MVFPAAQACTQYGQGFYAWALTLVLGAMRPGFLTLSLDEMGLRRRRKAIAIGIKTKQNRRPPFGGF